MAAPGPSFGLISGKIGWDLALQYGSVIGLNLCMTWRALGRALAHMASMGECFSHLSQGVEHDSQKG